MFSCDKCGTCCRNISGAFWAQEMILPSGVCKFLDEETNLCKIYATRPIFCNVDAFYEQFLNEKISREDFYEQNKISCLELRKLKSENRLENKIISLDSVPNTVKEKFELRKWD